MENKFDLTKFDKVMIDVETVKDKGNFIPDMSSKDGYEASKRFVLDYTMPMRKALEKAHKETKAPFWDACKFLDSKKKELTAIIESVEAPHKEAYKNRDAEIKRKKEEAEQAVRNRFLELDSLLIKSSSPSVSASDIELMIDDAQSFDVDPDFFGKRIAEYTEKLSSTMSQLSGNLTNKIQFEKMQKEQEEIAAKQREIEERERAIKEAEQAKIHEQKRAAYEAEQKEIELKRAAEREEAKIKHEQEMKALAEKQESERVQREKDQAEAARIEMERLEQAEKEARESRAKNRNKAAKQIMESSGVTKDQAISICNSIAAGDILFIRADF